MSVLPTKTTERPSLAINSDSDGSPTAAIGPGAGLTFVAQLFPLAQRIIRIASAYFTLPGYRLAREHIRDDVQLHVLVGREEDERVQYAVVEEILRDLAHVEMDLWDAVNDLVARIKRGAFFIRDARHIRTPFHCKFYICDRSALWHGSANYTHKGLTRNAEQATVSRDEREVEQFATWYDRVAAGADDILAPLLERLEAWLQLSTPFEVYLSALHHLYGFTPFEPGPQAHTPLYYQRAVVRTLHQQMERHGGAIGVVATGLGKTVIGSELAHLLTDSDRIDRVILIAPRSVHRSWDDELSGRGVVAHMFTRETLFRSPSRERDHRVSKLEDHLGRSGARTLLILDEAHFVRNQLLKEEIGRTPSLVLRRLNPPVQRGAAILLLTATPYGTSPKNLDSLLALLPQVENELGVPERWRAGTIPQFLTLPVVTKLGFPDVLRVARERGDVDAHDRPFVEYSTGRQYLPTLLHLRRIPFRPLLEMEVSAAFNAGCFVQANPVVHSYHDEEGDLQRSAADGVANASRFAWLSSPAAFRQALDRNLATASVDQLDAPGLIPGVRSAKEQLELSWPTALVSAPTSEQRAGSSQGYGTALSLSREERAKHIVPILAKLEELDGTKDEKIGLLSKILYDHCSVLRKKAIVFVRKWRTAIYLAEALKATFGPLSLGCTAMMGERGARLRPLNERLKLQRRFSPASHSELDGESPINVLISTDADSMGVNLQDAEVVINYDLPDAADALFQRAGRVLRLTPDPQREVYFYTFIPEFSKDSPLSSMVRRKAELSLARLYRRHGAVASILQSPVMAQGESERISLDVDVSVEEFLAFADFSGQIARAEAATAAQHFGVLEQHAAVARQLPVSLHSARHYDGSELMVFVLIRYQGRCIPLLFTPRTQALRQPSEVAALDIIACTPEEPRALVLAGDVERLANSTVRRWIADEQLGQLDVEKICSILLIPRHSTSDLMTMLL